MEPTQALPMLAHAENTIPISFISHNHAHHSLLREQVEPTQAPPPLLAHAQSPSGPPAGGAGPESPPHWPQAEMARALPVPGVTVGVVGAWRTE